MYFHVHYQLLRILCKELTLLTKLTYSVQEACEDCYIWNYYVLVYVVNGALYRCQTDI